MRQGHRAPPPHCVLNCTFLSCSRGVTSHTPRGRNIRPTCKYLAPLPVPAVTLPDSYFPHLTSPRSAGDGALLAPGAVALVACEEGPQHCVCPACRARRAAKEAKEAPAQPAPEKVKVEVKKFVKIGRPGYKGNLSMALAGSRSPTPSLTSGLSFH